MDGFHVYLRILIFTAFIFFISLISMNIKTIVGVALLFALPSLSADDHKEKIEKEKVHYFEASFSSFHPGANLRASEIIEEYWFPTDKNVGRLAIPFDLMAGEWDHVVFFYKPEGIADFKQNPDKVSQEWKKDIIKRLGEEEFVKLEKEFFSLIKKRTHAIFKLVGDLPKINDEFYNLEGSKTPVLLNFETFKMGKSEEGFDKTDQFRSNTGYTPMLFRAITGDYDQITIWKLPNDGKNLFNEQSEEMKNFMKSDAMQSYFKLIEESQSGIGTIPWAYSQ